MTIKKKQFKTKEDKTFSYFIWGDHWDFVFATKRIVRYKLSLVN